MGGRAPPQLSVNAPLSIPLLGGATFIDDLFHSKPSVCNIGTTEQLLYLLV